MSSENFSQEGREGVYAAKGRGTISLSTYLACEEWSGSKADVLGELGQENHWI